MSQPIRKTIGQIFIQFVLALIAFSVLAGVASANTIAAMNTTEIVKLNTEHLQYNFEQEIDADLFASPFAKDVARINQQKDLDGTAMFKNHNLLSSAEYMVNRRSQHQYSSDLDLQLRDDNQAWPFLSVTLKGQSVGIKLGSKYNN